MLSRRANNSVTPLRQSKVKPFKTRERVEPLMTMPEPRRRLIKYKWFQWFLMFISVSVLLPFNEGNPLVAVAFIYVVLFPSFMYVGAVWKVLRFNFFPSPVQLWKGFRRQWHAIERGPVVVRVHRKKPNQSST